MKTEVIDIDYKNVYALRDMIDKNPEWKLITCGSTIVESVIVDGTDRVLNFAVFQSEDDYAIFDE